MKIEPAWKALLTSLEEYTGLKSAVVIGSSDSGKTTLCRFLGKELARRHRTARIDCDPGQSVIGPPTCLGLGREPWDGGEPISLRFVGSKTPARHFMQMLTGVKRLCERADRANIERLIFDPPGYMDTDAGREFLFQMIDLIQPDHLVALQEDDKLEPLMAPFQRRLKPVIHRLPVSDAVAPRNPSKRISYRKQKFADYFADALQHRLDITTIGFHGRIPRFDDHEQYANQLVGLCDRRGFAVSVGIVEAIDRAHETITLFCPAFDADEISSVHFGSLHLNRSGGEI